MRIEIEIPKEFENDYKGDTFKDFFSRVLCDIENGTLCGNYEKEIAEMFIKAFDESKSAYNVEKVVAELDDKAYTTTDTVCGGIFEAIRLSSAIDIVRKGAVE